MTDWPHAFAAQTSQGYVRQDINLRLPLDALWTGSIDARDGAGCLAANDKYLVVDIAHLKSGTYGLTALSASGGENIWSVPKSVPFVAGFLLVGDRLLYQFQERRKMVARCIDLAAGQPVAGFDSYHATGFQACLSANALVWCNTGEIIDFNLNKRPWLPTKFAYDVHADGSAIAFDDRSVRYFPSFGAPQAWENSAGQGVAFGKADHRESLHERLGFDADGCVVRRFDNGNAQYVYLSSDGMARVIGGYIHQIVSEMRATLFDGPFFYCMGTLIDAYLSADQLVPFSQQKRKGTRLYKFDVRQNRLCWTRPCENPYTVEPVKFIKLGRQVVLFDASSTRSEGDTGRMIIIDDATGETVETIGGFPWARVAVAGNRLFVSAGGTITCFACDELPPGAQG